MTVEAGNEGGQAVENTGGESVFSFDQSQTQQPEAPKINPAWNDMLGALPTSLHQQVIPHLQNWDKGVQDRFTQVQQQYEPWKPFIEEGLSPDVIRGLTSLIENDPARLVQELVQFHGLDPATLFQQGQGQGQSDEFNLDQIQDPEPEIDLTKIPEFQQLQLQNQQLMQAWEGQTQQQLQEQANQEIQSELDAVKQANPNIVEPILLSLAMSLGMSVTEAAKKYDELMPKAPGPAAPTILSPSGGIPQAGGVKTHDMTPQQRQQLVQKILEANAASQD